MRGFYKAQDNENGHIYRSSHAFYSDLSCMRVFLNSVSAKAVSHTGLWSNAKQKTIKNELIEALEFWYFP